MYLRSNNRSVFVTIVLAVAIAAAVVIHLLPLLLLRLLQSPFRIAVGRGRIIYNKVTPAVIRSIVKQASFGGAFLDWCTHVLVALLATNRRRGAIPFLLLLSTLDVVAFYSEGLFGSDGQRLRSRSLRLSLVILDGRER